MELSFDQKECLSKIKAFLNEYEIKTRQSVDAKFLQNNGEENLVAILGRAGSGKTELLRLLVEFLDKEGVNSVNVDYESRLKDGNRYYAVLAPTNKAVSVLKTLGFPLSWT